MQNRDIGQSRASGLARGQIIRQLRLQEKVPAAELAKRLGVSPSVIAGWESGQIPVGDKVMQRVHDALKLPTHRLPPKADEQPAKSYEEIMETLSGILADNVILRAKVRSWKTKP